MEKCDKPIEPPVKYKTLEGFSGSEDFAFDDEGNLVSTDPSERLTKQKKTGESEVFSGRVGTTAGTAYLPSGQLAVASVDNGELLLFESDGGSSVLLSNIDYPNGVTVDLDGIVYVSEHNTGRVLSVDPTTKEKTIVASGIVGANGLGFSPDYQTLYVAGFGTGMIHKIERNGNSWKSPKLFAQTPNDEGDDNDIGDGNDIDGNDIDGNDIGDGNDHFVDPGGLDGLVVDACGYVYVTEFVVGIVWRIPPEGGDPVKFFKPGSEWMPNLHFGSGVGGWDEKKLYVMDRDRGRVFELDMKIGGTRRPFP